MSDIFIVEAKQRLVEHYDIFSEATWEDLKYVSTKFAEFKKNCEQFLEEKDKIKGWVNFLEGSSRDVKFIQGLIDHTMLLDIIIYDSLTLLRLYHQSFDNCGQETKKFMFLLLDREI